MEKTGALIGSKQSNLARSFNLAIRSLLTSCSKEDFVKAFPRFSNAEQESLHRLFVQVIASVHKMIEDEFESLCLETQVGTTLDTVEQIVEEQSLDPLFSQKTNVMDIVCDLPMTKKNEIHYLRGMLEKAEEQNRSIRERVEQLKSRHHDVSGTSDVNKLRSGILNLEMYGGGLEGV